MVPALHMLLTVGMSLLMIAKIAPYKTDRYLFAFYPIAIIIVVYAFAEIIENSPSNAVRRSAVGMLLAGVVTALGLSYAETGVNYLYKGYTEKLEIVDAVEAEYGLFITKTDHRIVTNELSWLFMQQKEILPYKYSDKEFILGDLVKEKDQNKYILYLDKDLGEKNIEKVVDQTLEALEFHNSKQLLETDRAFVYSISK